MRRRVDTLARVQSLSSNHHDRSGKDRPDGEKCLVRCRGCRKVIPVDRAVSIHEVAADGSPWACRACYDKGNKQP